MGFGPRSVRITSLMVRSPLQIEPSPRRVLGSAHETLRELLGASSTSLQTLRYSGAFALRRQQSDHSVRTRAPCEHTTCGGSPFETLPSPHGPSMHRKTGNSWLAPRLPLPDGALRLSPE